MSVLVTVGSTKFESLIQATTTRDFLETLHHLGYSSLRLQIGNGEYTPSKTVITWAKNYLDFTIVWFRLKPVSLFHSEIKQAKLVIGHAGAGTILETLRCGRNLLVVTNNSLMDNHQVELANTMENLNYLKQATPDTILKVLRSIDWKNVKSYPEPDKTAFARLIDEEMGFFSDVSAESGEES